MDQTEIKRIKASNESFFRALKTYDIKELGNHLRRFSTKDYKYYCRLTEIQKKRVLCEQIVKLKNELDDDKLFAKAQTWLKNNPKKKGN